MTYAAYLRIYEPVSAFHEPDRSRWAAYAASASRPRRRDSLSAERVEALRRAITLPQIAVPERESEHAYIRHADGVTYVCPWQTRLRCELAYRRMLSGAAAPDVGPVPSRSPRDVDEAMAALTGPEGAGLREPAGARGPGGVADRKGRHGAAARLHILGSVWTVPLAWFVLFAASERWLALGAHGHRAVVSPGRALIYTTAMSRARRRVARGLATLRGMSAGHEAAWEPVGTEAELAEVGRWLEEFHPYSIVELDYGGLVHLASDDALCGDQSAAEIAAALDGLAKGECELAIAMYKRAHSRWHVFAQFERAN